jgi:xylulokinase
MTLVAGVDSSTQSTKVVVCDADTGAVVRSGAAPHPDGTEVDPAAWEQALRLACGGGLLDGVEAISVAGQQHGMVLLDEQRDVVRPALLWNDLRSAPSARALVEELGGRAACAAAVGSVLVASFTVTKLRWVAEHEPAHADRAAAVLLPHDWLTLRVRGGAADLVTDRGDASGTGYWSPSSGAYRTDVLECAFGRALEVPRVLSPYEPAGETPAGVLVGPGTGDNMGAALGLGARAGDVVVSLGTSGTAFAVSPRAAEDETGAVAGFADASGAFLPLVATLNAARVLTAVADLLGTDHAGLDARAGRAPSGAEGLVLLPYLDGERSPDLPDAAGSLHGLTRTSLSPENLARAAVEGMLCGLADAVDALVRQGVEPRRVLLVGGAARSSAVQAVLPSLLGVPVLVPEPAEYVALGAARQAAAVLRGAEQPQWEVPGVELPAGDVAAGQRVRDAYARARERYVAAGGAG